MALDPQLLAKNRFCLVSDLDWTMVDHKDRTHENLLKFNRQWLTHFDQDSLLVFSTGRSPELFIELAGEVPLLTPDILVCSVGTEILIRGRSDAEWEAHLDQGWDRTQASTVASRFPELVMQRGSEQRPHKVSYKLYAADPAQAQGVISNLRNQLSSTGLDATVVFSGGEDVDILPSRASKGKALSFLLKQMRSAGAGPGAVMVCGDSGNDVELFAVPGVHGCVVANAHAELRQWCEANGHDKIFEATEDGPGGICEALHHFGFAADAATAQAAAGVSSRRSAVVDLHRWFESYFNAADPAGDENTGDIVDGIAAAAGAGGDDKNMNILESVLDAGFELVGPQGVVTSRAELIRWFREKGRGSRAAPTPHPEGLVAAATGLLAAGIAKGGPSGGEHDQSSPMMVPDDGSFFMPGGKFRIWVDSYSEKELVAGSNVWLVRYKELQQRFPTPAPPAVGGARTARWSTAVLKGTEDGQSYTWVYVQETWIDPPPASDPPPVLNE